MNEIPTPETDEILKKNAQSSQTALEDYEVLADHSISLERRLTVAREALQAAIDAKLIPISSVSEGGPMRHSEQVKVADQIREALTSTAPK